MLSKLSPAAKLVVIGRGIRHITVLLRTSSSHRI